MPWFAIGCTLTALSTALLLGMEQKDSLAGRWLTKPLASLGFVVAGLGDGLLGSAPGRWLLAGLVLSLVGDVALIPRSSKTFLAGLGSFLLGHVAFAVAFIKDTALVSQVGVFELTFRGKELNNEGFSGLLVFGTIAFLYFLMSYPLSRWGRWLEQRLAPSSSQKAKQRLRAAQRP